MTWPTSDVSTANLDAGTDTVPRTEFMSWAQKFNQLRNHVSAFWQGVLDKTTASDAQTALGATATGKALFTAADPAAVRTAAGATATGSSLMTAASNAAAFAAIKQAATESATGVVELATTAEASAGTDTTRAVTPAGAAAAIAALAPPAVVSMSSTETLAAGTTVRSRYDETVSRTSNIFASVATFGFVQSGTVRITLEHRTPLGADNSEARVVRARNGTDTTIQTWSTPSATFQSRSLDVSVLPGDTLRVQHRNTASSSATETRNLRLQTSGVVWWPGVTEARVE